MTPCTLLCLPFAGGSSLVFRDWAKFLPEWVRVLPIELPGRGKRFGEPLIESMPLLAEDAFRQVPRLQGPVAVFGHSMGGRLGFELTKRIERSGGDVAHLFVSACPAPHIPREELLHTLPDVALVARLRRFGGTPDPVFDEPELLAMFLPILRADFKVVETYSTAAGDRVRAPLHALHGTEDREISNDSMCAWAEHTSGRFSMSEIPGDHFFLQTHREHVLKTIEEDLATTLSQAR